MPDDRLDVEQDDDIVAEPPESANDAVRGLAHVDGATVILLDTHTLVRQVLLS